MEMTQLRYFKALAENGNLRKTAERLYITPSTLSNSISRLERELGMSLFDRIQGRLRLNDMGRIFLESVSSGLNEIDAGVNDIRRLSTRRENHVSIVSTNTLIWNDMIACFLRSRPDIFIHFRNYSEKQLRALPYFPHDFLLCSSNIWPEDTMETLVLTPANEVVVAVSRSHPLADREMVDLLELKDETFLFPPKGASLHALYYQMCRKAGFEPNVLAECDYNLTAHLQKQGLGITFTSAHAIAAAQAPEVVLLRLRDAPKRSAQRISWDKSRSLNSAAITFRDFAIEYWKEHAN